MQLDLLAPTLLTPTTDTLELIKLDHGWLRFYRRFLDKEESERYFAALLEPTPWMQDTIHIQGKSIPIPRLQAWYGDEGHFYTYSGITLAPLPWTPTLDSLRERIFEASQLHFNSLLINQYRNERDSVSWHSDDEPELGQNPIIASLSLGAARRFELKQKKSIRKKISLTLESGDLLIMGGELQQHWVHQVPKEAAPCQARINLTFRTIKKLACIPPI